MGGAPTPIRWIKEAEDLRPSGTSGTMSGKGGPRATLHCTVSRPTQFLDMHRVLIGKQAEPHLLYSFAEDRLGQYFPLDRSARALMGSGRTPSGLSHNRVGTVNIQIEVVGTTDDWTARPDWRPGPRFRAMMAAIASWGIEPRFIYRPALTAADRANVVRSFATMTGSAGGGVWWGHCHYPDGESHWDPGRVNVAKFFAAAYGTTPTSPEEDDIMAMTPAERAAFAAEIAAKVWGEQITHPNPDAEVKTIAAGRALTATNYHAWRGREAATAALAILSDPTKLATELAPLLPAGTAPSVEDLTAALRTVLGSVDNPPDPAA